MKAAEVRQKFLSYFQEKGHTAIPSSSVIPHGDRTLLFTNAGMNQFKEIFTGREASEHRRATTVQKCIRAGGKHNDLDNVGYTKRHLTFFEMLGNFSFGDYFKREAIAFAWELVTRRFGLSPRDLWITVYREDDEARRLWREVAGVAAERVVGLGEKDNFWSMGDMGPCGPCSEILVDRGDAFGEADLENGERFFEIWNLVFMQYDQRPDGTRGPLPRPSIDTGMGLERMAMVLQGADSVFEIDLFQRIIRKVEELTGAPYSPGPEGVSHRVIADHIRSLVFAFSDGAEPSNEGRGYVLRRILRRAARYARNLRQDVFILHQLVPELIAEMGSVYPEIREHEEYVTRVIQSEEERFGATLESGLVLFEDVVQRLRREGAAVVPGDDVFKLYDTYGFPADLVERMASEVGLTVDMPGFEARMEEQKERSRGASQFGALAGTKGELDVQRFPETEFRGYGELATRSEVLHAVEEGERWRVLLALTPFYAESGGQVGDRGRIAGDGFVLEVEDTQKDRGRFVHACRLLEGDPARVRQGALVEAQVDAGRRAATERNHTATHLLHAALRQTVGTHVHQKGSLVTDGRLRFDVTHFASFQPEELARAQALVLEHILADRPVETFEAAHAEALKMGAMALFGEKYGERVRVVRIGDFSIELCGGTHVERTGEIGPFLIAQEGSVSSGVRRIEALSGTGAEAASQRTREILGALSRALKAPAEELLARVEKLLEENRELRSRRKAAGPETEAGGGEAILEARVGDALVAGYRAAQSDGKDLRERYDRLKGRAPEMVAALWASAGDRAQALVAVTPGLVARGFDAREIFRESLGALGFKGGGRPEMVQGGGPAAAGAEAIDAALRAALERSRARLQGP